MGVQGKNRRGYSDDQKAEVLAILKANGGNINRTARETGVPYTTVQSWSHNRKLGEAVIAMGQEKEAALDTLFEQWIRKMIGIASSDGMLSQLGPREFQALATSIGIGTDKLQLLRGKPTDIQQVAEVMSDEQRVLRLAALQDEVDFARGLLPGEDGTTDLRGVRVGSEPEVPVDGAA